MTNRFPHSTVVEPCSWCVVSIIAFRPRCISVLHSRARPLRTSIIIIHYQIHHSSSLSVLSSLFLEDPLLMESITFETPYRTRKVATPYPTIRSVPRMDREVLPQIRMACWTGSRHDGASDNTSVCSTWTVSLVDRPNSLNGRPIVW